MIEQFAIDVPDAQLQDLKTRLESARWPDKETVADDSQGVPLSYMADFCRYWSRSYDWRSREKRLNNWPQFRTEIDGLGIHFVHCKSKNENAVPLILTHGWPGSFIEFLKSIDGLTTPRGDEEPLAFHVVCPSLPGYGFSDHPSETGWYSKRISHVWDELMQRLGYDHYFAQGGDWGAMVTTSLAIHHAKNCRGIHLNLPTVQPDPETIDNPTDQEKKALEVAARFDQFESGYAKIQSTRPQTLGYGLNDSPTGLAAWIIEKFWRWSDCGDHVENVFSRDDLIDNIMIYWISQSATSAARLYWESGGSADWGAPIDVPTGLTQSPKEVLLTSERWARKRFPNLIYWNELEQGGHFAAMEQPTVFVNEVRKCFSAILGTLGTRKL